MFAKIKNENGTIAISGEVVARIAGLSASECYGIVGMAAKSMKDGLVRLLKKESMSKGVRLHIDADNRLTVDLHIIVEYGTNINAIAETLISNVKYRVEDQAGLTVSAVNVFVEGVRV